MRILHTADVHLRADNDRTVAALETLLGTASDVDADLVTIGGDLFDSPDDAETLRPQLREYFRNQPFDTLVIPGNHDATVFEQNLDFGPQLDVLFDRPVTERSIGNVTVTGVPYVDRLDDGLFAQLRRESSSAEVTILLLHCTLDIGFAASDAGDEGTTSYFPISKSTLASLGYDYVLAGHIHSEARQIPLSNGGTFVYPGSPVSHSEGETGRRHAVLVDTEEKDVRSIPLETYYRDTFRQTVRPGEEASAIEAIETWVEGHADGDCDLSVHVDGHIEIPEPAFADQLATASGDASVTNETRTVAAVLDHPLYRQFENELEAADDIEDPEGVDDLVTGVLSRLLANREIRP